METALPNHVLIAEERETDSRAKSAPGSKSGSNTDRNLPAAGCALGSCNTGTPAKRPWTQETLSSSGLMSEACTWVMFAICQKARNPVVTV